LTRAGGAAPFAVMVSKYCWRPHMSSNPTWPAGMAERSRRTEMPHAGAASMSIVMSDERRRRQRAGCMAWPRQLKVGYRTAATAVAIGTDHYSAGLVMRFACYK